MSPKDEKQHASTYPAISWENNCALGAVATILHANLLEYKGDHSDSVFNTKPSYGAFLGPCEPYYKNLLKSFSDTYRTTFRSWSEIRDLSNSLAHPFDIQAFWALPLRHLLAKQLLGSAKLNKSLYEQFITVANSVYKQGEHGAVELKDLIADYPNVLHSNLDIMHALQVLSLKKNDDKPNFSTIVEKALKPYWDTIGFKRYCYYMRDGIHVSAESETNKRDREGNTKKIYTTQTPQISAEELSILCESLLINLEVYGPNREKNEIDYTSPCADTRGYQGREKSITLKASCFGMHWQCVTFADHREAETQNTLVSLCDSIIEQSNYQSEQSKSLLIRHALRNKDEKHAVKRLIRDHDTLELVRLMSTPTRNIIIEYLIRHEDILYLNRIKFYYEQFIICKQSNDKTTLKDIIYAADLKENYCGMPSLNDMENSWYCIEYYANQLPLTRSEKEHGVNVLHVACIGNGDTRFSVLTYQMNRPRSSYIGPGAKYRYMLDQAASWSGRVGYTSLDIPDATGVTPLMYLCIAGNAENISRLKTAQREEKLNLKRKDKFGNSLLHLGVYSGDEENFVSIATFICNEANNDELHSLLEPNNAGLTPFALALSNQNQNFVQYFINYKLFSNADIEHVKKSLPNIIYSGDYRSLDMITSSFSSHIYGWINELKLFHAAARNLDYLSCHVLLHSISKSQRKDIILSKNLSGQTPYQILKLINSDKKIDKPRSEQRDVVYKKTRRLLAQYDVDAYNDCSDGYSLKYNNDLLELLRITSSYQFISKGVSYGPSLYAAATTLTASLNPYAAGEAAFFAFYGGDFIDNGEKISQQASSLLEKNGNDAGIVGGITKGVADTANWLFWGANWMRNTTRRVTTLAVANLCTYSLNTELGRTWICSMFGATSSSPEKSFIAYLEVSGAITAINETIISSHFIAPYLEAQFGKGFEGTFEDKYQCTLNQAFSDAAKNINSGIANYTGLNPRVISIKAYLWFRKNVGKVEGDLFEQILEYHSLTTEELLQLKKDSQLRNLVHIYSPEMLARLAFDLSIGEENPKEFVATFLADCMLDYELSFNPDMGKEAQNSLLDYYKGNFIRSLDENKNNDETKNVCSIRDILNIETANIEERGVGLMVQNYSENKDKDPNQFARDIIDILGIDKQYQEPFLKLALSTIDECQHDFTLLKSNLLRFVSAFASPMQDAYATVDYLQDLGLRAQANGINFGNSIAEVVTFMLLQHKTITTSQADRISWELSEQINHHYWSDQNSSKADFKKTLKSVLEIYFKATLLPTDNAQGKLKHTNAKQKEMLSFEGTIYYGYAKKITQYPREHWAEHSVNLLKKEHPNWFKMPGAENIVTLAFQNKFTEIEVANTFKQLILFFDTPQYVSSFLNGNAVARDAISLNGAYSPRMVRAAFAIHYVANSLGKSENYNSLTLEQQFALFSELCAIHNDNTFMAKIEKIATGQAISTKEMEISPGETPASLSVNVEAKSHDYAENKWPNVFEFQKRKMNEQDQPGEWRKAWNEIKTKVGAGLLQQGVNFGINGSGQASVNAMNLFNATYNIVKPNNSLVFPLARDVDIKTPQGNGMAEAPKSVVINDTPNPLSEPASGLLEPAKPSIHFQFTPERFLPPTAQEQAVELGVQELQKQFALDSFVENDFYQAAQQEANNELLQTNGGQQTGQQKFVNAMIGEPLNWFFSTISGEARAAGMPTESAPAFAAAFAVLRELGKRYAGRAAGAAGKEIVKRAKSSPEEAPSVPPQPAQVKTHEPNKDDDRLEHPMHQDGAPISQPFPSTDMDTGEIIYKNPIEKILQPASTTTPAAQPGSETPLVTGFPAEKQNGGILYQYSNQNPDHKHNLAPDTLPAFPDAKKARKKSHRERWKISNKRILEWDYQHGEIEMYNKNGIHIGAFDPNTGEKIKDAIKGRKIEP
jgi:hypothetical protein